MAETTPLKTLTPLRTLFLNLMFSLLVASAVFVVVAKILLVPQLAREELEIRQLRAEVTGMRAELDAATEEEAAKAHAAPAAAPAPAAPAAAPAGAVPASAPVPTGK